MEWSVNPSKSTQAKHASLDADEADADLTRLDKATRSDLAGGESQRERTLA